MCKPEKAFCIVCSNPSTESSKLENLVDSPKVLRILENRGYMPKPGPNDDKICTMCAVTVFDNYDRTDKASDFLNDMSPRNLQEMRPPLPNGNSFFGSITEAQYHSPHDDFQTIENSIIDNYIRDRTVDQNISDEDNVTEDNITAVDGGDSTAFTQNRLIITSVQSCVNNRERSIEKNSPNDSLTHCKLCFSMIHQTANHFRNFVPKRTKSIRKSREVPQRVNCVKCNKSLRDEATLMRHMRQHIIKPKCRNCGMEMDNDLEGHELICNSGRRMTRSMSRAYSIATRRSSITSNTTGATSRSRASSIMSCDDDAISVISCVTTDDLYATYHNKLRQKQRVFHHDRRSSNGELKYYEEEIRLAKESNEPKSRTKKKLASAMELHLLIKERQEKQYSDVFKKTLWQGRSILCNYCNIMEDGIENMMRHELDVHKSMLLFRCPECRTKFTKKKYLVRHRMGHLRPIQCFECCAEFENRIMLEHHLSIHDNEDECMESTTKRVVMFLENSIKTPIHHTIEMPTPYRRDMIQTLSTPNRNPNRGFKRQYKYKPNLGSFSKLGEDSNDIVIKNLLGFVSKRES